jgi:membrane fusion protein (multidrug efflux system)
MESPNKALDPKRKKARRAYTILAVLAVLVAGGWLFRRWLTAGKESTDDAQVDADVLPVAGRVGGVIKKVLVSDHQLVKAGQPLYELDTADLDIEVQRADAELQVAKKQAAAARAQVAVVQSTSTGGVSTAKAQLTGATTSVRGAADQVRAAEASVAKAKADLANATTELARTQTLFDQKAITRSELDHAQQMHDVAKAGVDAATAQLDLARSQRDMTTSRVAEAQGRVAGLAAQEQVDVAEANAQLAETRVKSAEVAADKAKLQRSYAVISAPVAGYVSRLAARVGQTIQAGQSLLMLVPDQTYVVANFKESQIRNMHTGDEVDVELDAFPGETLHGKVETLSPATGARFSLIPPDNATGNFVKVVQRVPVKISWTSAPTIAMRPGLSAEVTVHVH